MKTKPTTRADLTVAQESIQTLVLIILSFATAWMVYRVPWQVSGDPCHLAAIATVVVVVSLWLNRWAGLPGVSFEQNLLTGFLVGMPFVYVAAYLFDSKGRAANLRLGVEVLGIPLFATLAVLGRKRSSWFLAIGIVTHGIAWDSWHYRTSPYIPDWYALFCSAVDLASGAYVATRVPLYRRASQS